MSQALPYHAPTATVVPVANTTAGIWTFDPSVLCIYIANTSGQTVSLRFNAGASGASTTLCEKTIANSAEATLHAKDYGVESFSEVSVWFPAAATVGNFIIRGV